MYALPALFVTEYAMARLWMSWGVEPDAMIGHSLGEYVAACLAGVLPLEDALALVALRAKLFEGLPEGAMLSVPLSENELRPLLNENISLAAINAPSFCVVSGSVEAIGTLEQLLRAKSIDFRRLHISTAGHSSMVEPMLDEFVALARKQNPRLPKIPYISNVTGAYITAAEALDKTYWAKHLRQTVRFEEGIARLLAEPRQILLEVGPGQMLSTLARQHPAKAAGQVVLSSLRHPNDKQPDMAFALKTLGRLWLTGAEVDWQGFHAHERRQRLPLPAPCWERPAETEEAEKSDSPTQDLRANLQNPYVAPSTEVESKLCEIWQELLGIEQVGTRDNFFELGGHSLLATRLFSRVREVFGAELFLGALLERPTVAGLAQSIADAAEAGEKGQAEELKIVGRDEPLPLSLAQQRLWFLEQLEPSNPFYNVGKAFLLEGPLDHGALALSLNRLVARHEALRTFFVTRDAQPQQFIEPALTIALPVTDLRHLPEAERHRAALDLAAEQARLPFDLTRLPLVRASLFRLSDERHLLVLTIHHIVFDGWSMGVLLRELGASYSAALRGAEPTLPALPVQYGDFAVWQRNRLQDETLAELSRYWREQLRDAPPLLGLATDMARPGVQGYRGARLSLGLGVELSEGLRGLSREAGVTLFMTLLAGYKALLSRYTGEADVCIGTPTAGRGRGELEGLIGFFVNMMVVRSRCGVACSFLELVSEVKEAVLGGARHDEMPFERLVEEAAPGRDLSYSPIFQVMFVFQNDVQPLDLLGVSAKPVEVESGTSKYDLTLFVSEHEEELVATLEYNTDLFLPETIERMLRHLRVLLEGVVAEPRRAVGELPLLTEPERALLLGEWARSQEMAAPPRRQCIHHPFEAQAARTPEKTALVYEGEEVSYAELNRRADTLARRLRWLGVGPEVRVGIYQERGVGMVVSLLAVLKAGGAYVPLDPEYPAERVRYMMDDAGVEVMLTQRNMAERARESVACKVVSVEDEEEAAASETAAAVEEERGKSEAGGDNLAYVIYTSGSTGRPKGVAIEHRSAVVLLHWAREVFSEEQLAGTLASTSICFDLSVFELFVPLSCGGKVILAKNALHLPSLLAANEVTLVNTVPSAMTELVRMGGVPSSVRVVNLAGEPLQRELVQRVYEQETIERVFNLYGPSEDTTYSTFVLLDKDSSNAPTIGRPVGHTEIYLLDEHLNPVPQGVAGQLYIGGSGLARGYLRRPSLTAERFIPHPFSAEPGARLYKTGDLARFLPGGELQFLGRADEQVKLWGYRIEKGEIEAALREHGRVSEAVVEVREWGGGEKRLVGYVVLAEGGGAEDEGLEAELREHLRRKLPGYMVPSAFVALDSLPLTPNGKIDRRALPSPADKAGAKSCVAPRTELENKIAMIWAKVLKRERVYVHDNFFELGGHSLLAAQIISRIGEDFKVDLPLRGIFSAPTVAELASEVAQLQKDDKGYSVAAIERAAPVDVERLLANLGLLSDEQVESLLGSIT
jgi:amino acid adenylation domain-containing protein